jgi:hypothetical protein
LVDAHISKGIKGTIANPILIPGTTANPKLVTNYITKVNEVYVEMENRDTYGYDYNVTASGNKLVGYRVNGSATKDIYQDVYLLNIERTNLDYDYRVIADGIKFIGYQVKGFATKDIYQDIYTLNIERTNLDYDYRVIADGIKFIGYEMDGEASRDLYQDVYLLDIEKTYLDYDYEVVGTGVKTYYDVISKYAKLVNLNYLVEYMELGKGSDVELLPPQTGVEYNLSFINVFISIVVGLYFAIRNSL